jgi:hypothetical protein
MIQATRMQRTTLLPAIHDIRLTFLVLHPDEWCVPDSTVVTIVVVVTVVDPLLLVVVLAVVEDLILLGVWGLCGVVDFSDDVISDDVVSDDVVAADVVSDVVSDVVCDGGSDDVIGDVSVLSVDAAGFPSTKWTTFSWLKITVSVAIFISSMCNTYSFNSVSKLQTNLRN